MFVHEPEGSGDRGVAEPSSDGGVADAQSQLTSPPSHQRTAGHSKGGTADASPVAPSAAHVLMQFETLFEDADLD
jgi:hypothetical protein